MRGMTIYLLIFVLLLCFSFIRKEDKALKTIYYCFVVFLIFFSGLKGSGIGFDYENYAINIYKNDDASLIEPGFSLIVTILRPFNNVNVFFLFVAFLAIFIKASLFLKYSYYPLLSLLIYYTINYILNDMGQIRYGLAMALSLAAIFELCNERKKRFWLWQISAVLIHYSALIVVPLYFVRNKVFSRKEIITLLLIFVVFVFVNIDSLFMFIMDLMPIDHIKSKIYFYLFEEEYHVQLGVNFSLIMRLVVLYLFYQTKENYNNTSYFLNTVFNGYFLGILIYMLFNSLADFAIRGSGYFKILDIIIIPYILHINKNKILRFSLLSLTLLYSFYSIYKVLFDIEMSKSYIPYRTILFE